MAVGPGLLRALQPPTGGWDTLSALSDMPEENAVVLDNWFPNATDVTVRRGWRVKATGLPGAVETLMTYAPPLGDSKQFAAAGDGIYDVTAPGAVGPAEKSGFSSARWQSVQIGTAGGHYIFACNAEDTAQLYDGSAWADTTMTGPDVTNLAWCNIHQRRLWVGEANSLKVWYLAVNSITGAASSFDFSALCKLGGYMVAMASWSRDGGSGPQDLAVFLTSEGEVLLYTGTDPATAGEWQLSSIFRLGRPLGRRCFVKIGGDLAVMTEDGFVPLSTALPIDRAQTQKIAITQNINPSVAAAARVYRSSFGWQGMTYPRGQMLIFNIPQGSAMHQYVFNTLTGAACRFTGIPALCWGLLGDDMQFGSADGRVCTFDTGTKDDDSNIVAEATQAFNYFGSATTMKAFKRAEIIFQSTRSPAAAVDLALDYDLLASAPAIPDEGPTTVAVWGTAVWGASVWGGPRVYKGWRGVRGYARAASLRVRVSSRTATPKWLVSNVLFTPGNRT